MGDDHLNQIGALQCRDCYPFTTYEYWTIQDIAMNVCVMLWQWTSYIRMCVCNKRHLFSENNVFLMTSTHICMHQCVTGLGAQRQIYWHQHSCLTLWFLYSFLIVSTTLVLGHHQTDRPSDRPRDEVACCHEQCVCRAWPVSVSLVVAGTTLLGRLGRSVAEANKEIYGRRCTVAVARRSLVWIGGKVQNWVIGV